MTSDEKDWAKISNASQPSGPDGTPPQSETESSFERTGPTDSSNGGEELGETGEPPPEEPVTPSWERREEVGFTTALFNTIGEVLLHPVTAFSHVPVTGNLGNPLLFTVLLGTVGSIFQAFYSIIGLGIGMFFSRWGEIAGPNMGMRAATTVTLMILSPILVAIGAFIGAGILHLFLMLFGGATRGFEATFKVVAYVGGAVAVLEMIPICGSWIVFVWGMVGEIIGAREVHETDTWRALLAVIAPWLLCCCCVIATGAAFGLFGFGLQVPSNVLHSIP